MTGSRAASHSSMLAPISLLLPICYLRGGVGGVLRCSGVQVFRPKERRLVRTRDVPSVLNTRTPEHLNTLPTHALRSLVDEKALFPPGLLKEKHEGAGEKDEAKARIETMPQLAHRILP